jgi:ankyrin repeat protein
VGNKQYRCHVERCAFTSNRKDNLKRHRRKTHSSTHLRSTVEDSNGTQSLYEQSDITGDTQLYDVLTFMRVAASGDLDILDTFLSSGLTVETRADDQSTVLHCAARAGEAETVRYLLTKGASVDARNDKRRLPVHEAILSNSPETLDCFLERMTRDELHASEQELERYLVQSSQVDIVDIYLARFGSYFTDQDASKRLSFAVRTGHYSFVTYLLGDPNINPNHRMSTSLMAPIHEAAFYGRTRVMELLITCDRVDKTLEAQRSRQALHIAASKGHTLIVEQLIRHPKVHVNCEDYHGATPLHYASSNGCTIVVEWLIRHPSVDVDCKDFGARTPIHYAAANGHWRTVSLLLTHWEKKNDDHHSSSEISFDKENLLHRLLRHPDFGDPNKVITREKYTLLHAAAKKGDCELMGVLLAHQDIDVNVENRYDESPLTVATERGQLEAMELLLQHKDIDVNSKDRNFTPLTSAARRGRLEAVNLLLQHKDVDVNQREECGRWTALQWAKRMKHDDIVDLLLSHGAIDYDANPPSTVPTTTQIASSQNTTLQTNHELPFPHSADDMNDRPTEAWEDFLGMDEEMEE